MAGSLIYGRWLATGNGQNNSFCLIKNGGLYQEDGTIVEVGESRQLRHKYPTAPLIGGRDCFILPGLVNAHHHGNGLTALHMGAADDTLELWLLSRLGSRPVDPYLNTLFSCIKQLKAGITTVLHSHVGGDPGAILRAYSDAGMRVSLAVHANNQHRFVYQEDSIFIGSLPPRLRERLTQAFGPAPNFSEEAYFDLCGQLQERLAPPRARILFGPSGIQWCSQELLLKIKEKADAAGSGIHTHLLESVCEYVYGHRAFGVDSIVHLKNIGFLGRSVSFAHGVWVTEQEIELLAQSETSVCHNPTSNLRLKSGICPVNRLIEAGVNVGLGLDSSSFNEDEDIWMDMRLCYRLHREPGIEGRQIAPEVLLRMTTLGGARAALLGNWVGSLEAGKRADVVIVDLKRMESPYLDPELDPLEALVCLCQGRDVRTVLIDGQPVVEKGRVITVNEKDVQKELRASLKGEIPARARELGLIWKELKPHVVKFYRDWTTGDGPPHYRYNSK